MAPLKVAPRCRPVVVVLDDLECWAPFDNADGDASGEGLRKGIATFIHFLHHPDPKQPILLHSVPDDETRANGCMRPPIFRRIILLATATAWKDANPIHPRLHAPKFDATYVIGQCV